MNQDVWLAALAVELRRHGLNADLVEHVVAETAAHLNDSGERPLPVFGPPGEYASAIADRLGAACRPISPRRAGVGAAAAGAVRLEVRGVTSGTGASWSSPAWT